MDFPFIGPSYQSYSLNVDAQRAVNLFPEIVESKNGKNKWVLYGTPGLTTAYTLPTTPIRGMWEIQGVVYAVSGNTFYSLNPGASTYNTLGTLLTNTGFVGIADNTVQICIVDGANEYIWNIVTSTWSVNPAGGDYVGSTNVSFVDDYFVFSQPDTRVFYLSALNDGTTINPLDTATKEGNSDQIQGTFVDHRQLYVIGGRTMEPWYDSGALTFPFQPIQGVFIETGVSSIWTVAKTNDTFFFLGKNQRGGRFVFKMQGFVPVRVSTHAIEEIIESWGNDLSGCSAFVYEERGHSYYALNPPSGQGSSTLYYDDATEQWHERCWLNPDTGLQERHRAQFHAVQTGGIHLFGDYALGNIYVSNLNTYTDDGNPILRTRISPHGFNDLKRVFYSRFQVDIEPGVGLAGSGAGSNPQLYMQYSDDGGHNYNTARPANMGMQGKTRARAFWNQCGEARDRVWQVYTSDPVKVVLIDATVNARVGRN